MHTRLPEPSEIWLCLPAPYILTPRSGRKTLGATDGGSAGTNSPEARRLLTGHRRDEGGTSWETFAVGTRGHGIPAIKAERLPLLWARRRNKSNKRRMSGKDVTSLWERVRLPWFLVASPGIMVHCRLYDLIRQLDFLEID